MAQQQWKQAPTMEIDESHTYGAEIKTSEGIISARLFASEAPQTVNNFVFLARQGFYEGVIFHRVIEGFMIQTGDPTGTGSGGPGYQFRDEPVKRKYTRGILAMANSGRHTNGSQFFIMHGNAGLPPNYTVFGEVTDGLDTVDKIATTPKKPGGEGSTPVNPPRIESVTISEA